MRHLLLMSVGLVLLAIPVSLKAQDVAYDRKEDVIYGRKYGTALTMDVFAPKDHANGAGIVWVVSGGWVSDHGHGDLLRCPVVAERIDTFLTSGSFFNESTERKAA